MYLTVRARVCVCQTLSMEMLPIRMFSQRAGILQLFVTSPKLPSAFKCSGRHHRPESVISFPFIFRPNMKTWVFGGSSVQAQWGFISNEMKPHWLAGLEQSLALVPAPKPTSQASDHTYSWVVACANGDADISGEGMCTRCNISWKANKKWNCAFSSCQRLVGTNTSLWRKKEPSHRFRQDFKFKFLLKTNRSGSWSMLAG